VLKAKPSDIHVPETIQGIIAARMDRLEEDLKRIMQVASVIGREFAFRILHAITEMKEGLKSNLLNLQGLEFIYEKSLFPELEYIFRHALTQEVAYNSLLVKRRKEIHEKIAQAIEELYPARLEEFFEMLAHHYSRSENKAKACHYLKLSGDKAWHSSSASEAFTFYMGAIKLLRELGDTRDNLHTRLEIFQSMGYPIRMLGFPVGSIECLEEGESLAQELMDQKARAYFQTNIGIYYLTAGGDPLKGRAYVERGLEDSELTDEVELIVPATDDLISSYIIEGKYSKVSQIAPKLIALIEKTQTEDKLFGRPSNQYSILHGYYGLSLGALGKFVKGERLLEKGLSYARDVDNPISIAQVEMVYGAFYFFKGDPEKMVKHWLSSTKYMEKSQFRMFQGPLWAWLGLGYLYSGRTDKALKYAEQGLGMHTHHGINAYLGSIHLVLSEIYLEQGALEKALGHAEKGVSLSLKNNEKSFEAESRLALGRVLAAVDPMKFDEAREQLLQGIGMLDELQIKPRYAAGLVHMGELFAGSGQKEEAFKNLKKAEAMFREMGMGYWLDRVREVLRVLQS
jgi:tetratricopeptide (TPR) repeat protein